MSTTDKAEPNHDTRKIVSLRAGSVLAWTHDDVDAQSPQEQQSLPQHTVFYNNETYKLNMNKFYSDWQKLFRSKMAW